ncbi:MAG: hypothetical protein ACHRHE_16705 [Tepidisphaerales bacterium]
MVMYYLVLALICVAPLALATTTRLRVMASTAIVLAIGLALFDWNIAVVRWIHRIRTLNDRLTESSATTTSPASRPAVPRLPESMPTAQLPANNLVIRVADKPPRPPLRGDPFWLRVGDRGQPLMDSLGHTVDIQWLLARSQDDALILYFVFDSEEFARTKDLARAIRICQDALQAVPGKSIEVYVLITVERK